MKTISLKTFNAFAITLLTIVLLLIFSFTFSSCKKTNDATAIAILPTKEITLAATAVNTVGGKVVIAENAGQFFYAATLLNITLTTAAANTTAALSYNYIIA